MRLASLKFKDFDGNEREWLVNPSHVVSVFDAGEAGCSVRVVGMLAPMELSEAAADVLRKLGAEIVR